MENMTWALPAQPKSMTLVFSRQWAYSFDQASERGSHLAA